MAWPLLALLAWGLTPPQVPPVSQPAPVPVAAQTVPPAPAPPETDASRIARLKALVEETSQAVAAEDFAAASDRLDDVDVLTADWSAALLGKPEVQTLLQQVQDLASQIPDQEGGGTGDGLKEPAEVLTLSGEDLRAELNRVRTAERDTSYDFPIDLNDKVLTWVNLFTTVKKGFIENALGRASEYLPLIRQVFSEEGIPQDLAYLAVIESGFRNEAKSRARALGMWQFIRSTGRLYGLASNRWVEERRDPVKATRAAARYLKRLYQDTGDWYLAVSSYNAGPLSLERASENIGTRNFWDLARSPWLRNETKNYVPELCAAILVGRHPDRYGIQVQPLPPFTFETVEVHSRTSLATIARLAGTDTATLRNLNPELLRGFTPPGAYTVRVPAGKGLLCSRALAREGVGKPVRERIYRIRRGDSLIGVARRFKVDAEDLLAENDISRKQFRPGRRLRIPEAEPVSDGARPKPLPALPYLPGADVASFPQARNTAAVPPVVNPAPLRVPEPATADATAPLVPPPAPEPVHVQAPPPPPVQRETRRPEPREVRARPGDTLARLARAHGVPLGELIRLNPEAARRLHPGDLVRLPGAAEPRARRGEVRPKGGIHVVRRGETLDTIAREHHLEVSEHRRWNHLKGSRIRAGQRLRLAPR
jgi:membrane-bound lytic murein transglycosylase D